ncbi:MAG: hypothetical protein [Caudoviricetes sp.]|nr:MAG: hypothetical protein [Caudoviricetes sp.]
MVNADLYKAYEEYFNSLPYGAEALSFHEWLECTG